MWRLLIAKHSPIACPVRSSVVVGTPSVLGSERIGQIAPFPIHGNRRTCVATPKRLVQSTADWWAEAAPPRKHRRRRLQSSLGAELPLDRLRPRLPLDRC